MFKKLSMISFLFITFEVHSMFRKTVAAIVNFKKIDLPVRTRYAPPCKAIEIKNKKLAKVVSCLKKFNFFIVENNESIVVMEKRYGFVDRETISITAVGDDSFNVSRESKFFESIESPRDSDGNRYDVAAFQLTHDESQRSHLVSHDQLLKLLKKWVKK